MTELRSYMVNPTAVPGLPGTRGMRVVPVDDLLALLDQLDGVGVGHSRSFALGHNTAINEIREALEDDDD